jgi:hypothetical protein
LITKVKPNINSVEVHPQLSYNGHPMDHVLVGAGSLWPELPSPTVTKKIKTQDKHNTEHTHIEL